MPSGEIGGSALKAPNRLEQKSAEVAERYFQNVVFLCAYFLEHRGHRAITEFTEGDAMLCGLPFELRVLCDEIEFILGCDFAALES